MGGWGYWKEEGKNKQRRKDLRDIDVHGTSAAQNMCNDVHGCA
jgi:hypothetical protein